MDFRGWVRGGVEDVVDQYAAGAAVLAGADGVELAASDPAFDGRGGDAEAFGGVALADRFGRSHRRLRSVASRSKRWSCTIRRLPLLAPTATSVKRPALTHRSTVALLTPSI